MLLMARFPLGMYTLPDGVRTRHDGSKSTPSSVGLPVTRPFIRLIVGLRGGTSGGAEGGTPSRRQLSDYACTLILARRSTLSLRTTRPHRCCILPTILCVCLSVLCLQVFFPCQTYKPLCCLHVDNNTSLLLTCFLFRLANSLHETTSFPPLDSLLLSSTQPHHCSFEANHLTRLAAAAS